MKSIREGQSWQFDKTISEAQSEKALNYLHAMGFQAELVMKDMGAMPDFGFEELAAPDEPAPKKGLFGFLKGSKKPKKEKKSL